MNQDCYDSVVRLTHISLFAGIGGDTLAAEWAGFETVCLVEIDKFCQKVLKRHWPNIPIVEDVRNVEEIQKAIKGQSVTLLTGGFPCQSVSIAGKRRGKADDRYLWPEMLAVIKALTPRWVVAENVYGLLSAEQGNLFDQALSDLESEGYETLTIVLPACAVDAPHRRDRVFIIAHTQSPADRFDQTEQERWSNNTGQTKRDAANSTGQGLERAIPEGTISGRCLAECSSFPGWQENWYEVAARFCGMGDGATNRVDSNRVNRLKALGNAIVPQQIYPVLKAIADMKKDDGYEPGK